MKGHIQCCNIHSYPRNKSCNISDKEMKNIEQIHVKLELETLGVRSLRTELTPANFQVISSMACMLHE